MILSTEDILYWLMIGGILLFSSSSKNDNLNKCLKQGYIEIESSIIICKEAVYK